jgi:hypothetical protein
VVEKNKSIGRAEETKTVVFKCLFKIVQYATFLFFYVRALAGISRRKTSEKLGRNPSEQFPKKFVGTILRRKTAVKATQGEDIQTQNDAF